MTDYNDGNWWGWNGGECPVHPLSTVECRVANADDTVNGAHMEAQCWHWNLARDVPSAIVAFRVVKAYREPREFWLNEYPTAAAAHESKASADEAATIARIACIRVREVLE